MRTYAAFIAVMTVFAALPAWSCDAFLSDQELVLTEQKSEAELLALIKEAEAETQAKQIAEVPK